ncbi:hypothetical protein HUS23_07940 [Ectothiorhodospiraceae bacterium 2226]|nr:hypothetical protein HUS23_07940 [Ectothiorhodospiraceae bacterium 2226]
MNLARRAAAPHLLYVLALMTLTTGALAPAPAVGCVEVPGLEMWHAEERRQESSLWLRYEAAASALMLSDLAEERAGALCGGDFRYLALWEYEAATVQGGTAPGRGIEVTVECL